MSGVGYQDNLSRTSDFTLSMDLLIQMALENVGVLPAGETIQAEDYARAKNRLNLIVREFDEAGKWRWSIPWPVHIPLVAGVSNYDGNLGLPINVSELISVVYRNAQGKDSGPLKILQAEDYEAICDKLETGEPKSVYLTDSALVQTKMLYVWPTLSTVTAQSLVIGTDDNIYRCVYPHTSSSNNYPTTGPNWRMVWELGSGGTNAWVTNTAYTAGESLRIVYRRPLFDFTASEHIPDFPPQLQRLLLDRLVQDLAQPYKMPLDEQTAVASRIQGAYNDVFASLKPKTNNIHNKVQYF